MLLKHKKTKEIYPFSIDLFNTHRFEIFDPLAPIDAPSQTFFSEKLKFYTKETISKESAEIELENCLTDKEYRELLKRLYG